MSYIKFHGGQFNICTSGTRKGSTRANWYELTIRPHHEHVNSLELGVVDIIPIFISVTPFLFNRLNVIGG